jgi:hypothetical protein
MVYINRHDLFCRDLSVACPRGWARHYPDSPHDWVFLLHTVKPDTGRLGFVDELDWAHSRPRLNETPCEGVWRLVKVRYKQALLVRLSPYCRIKTKAIEFLAWLVGFNRLDSRVVSEAEYKPGKVSCARDCTRVKDSLAGWFG